MRLFSGQYAWHRTPPRLGPELSSNEKKPVTDERSRESGRNKMTLVAPYQVGVDDQRSRRVAGACSPASPFLDRIAIRSALELTSRGDKCRQQSLHVSMNCLSLGEIARDDFWHANQTGLGARFQRTSNRSTWQAVCEGFFGCCYC